MTELKSSQAIRRVVLLALVMAVLSLGFLIIRPFLEAIFYAVVLAVAFWPLFRKVHRRVKRPAAASAITLLGILLLVLAPMLLVGVQVAGEARSAYDRLAARSVEAGGWTEYLAEATAAPMVWISRVSGVPAPDVRARVLDKLKEWSATLAGWAGSLVGNIAAALVESVIVLFTLFFLFLHGDDIREGFYAWLPLGDHRVDELLGTVADAILANVYGIAVVAIVQGVLIGLGFLATGLPSPFLWGLIGGLASLVPLAGASLVWLPAALILFLSGAWIRGIVMILWGVLLVSMADNIIRPLMLKGRSNMNTLIVFFSLMGGLQVFGFLGLFAGPVIFSVAMPLLRILGEELGLVEEGAKTGGAAG